jgi:hypothetical protein
MNDAAKSDPCPRCGANLRLVGRAHNCIPRSVATVAADMANTCHVANDMANRSTVDVANKASTTYRYRDVETRRNYMRTLMRRKRATEKMASAL